MNKSHKPQAQPQIIVDSSPTPAWAPAFYEPADISAVQALSHGVASSDQQKRALDWLINRVALTYDLDYRPDSREHAFASGRRFVGLQLVKALHLNVSQLKATERTA